MAEKIKSTKTTDARFGAYEVLRRVEQGGYADRLLDAFLKKHPTMDGRERGLMTELVYGILRLRGRLDFALGKFSRQPLIKLEPKTLLLLRLGAYQLLELDRIPAHAAVHASVELAHQVGMSRVAGLVNGTLRSLDRERDSISWPTADNLKGYLKDTCSLPGWLAKELLRQFPNAESCALAESLAKPAPMTLRVNTLETNRDAFLAQLEVAGHEARACRYTPDGVIIEKRSDNSLPGDKEGWYQVQDEASMLMAHLLDAQPGETILDACAAPGGKTTHIATLTEGKASILALDKHPQRVDLIKQGAKRLGISSIEAKAWDLTEAPDFLEPESFDRILVDAPCSGLGVLRRNPESRWTRKAADIKELAALQLTILKQVAPLLKTGGHLLYSVCTFTAAETDAVIKDFLASHPDFKQENLQTMLPDAWQELTTEEGTVRTYPHHHDGMDAFFAVRLIKS